MTRAERALKAPGTTTPRRAWASARRRWRVLGGASLIFHAGGLHHPAEPGALVVDELDEGCARAADRLDAHGLELVDCGRVGHGLVDGGGHLVEDVGRGAGGRMQAGPVRDLQV